MDMGDTQPIRQHAYQLPIKKHRRMEKEVEHGVAEPACWACLCFLADKADVSGLAQISERLMLSSNLALIQCLAGRTVSIR